MAMAPIDFDGAVPIDGYGPGFVRLGGQVYRGAMLILGGQVLPWGGLDDSKAVAALAGRADLLLIGLGGEIGRAPPALLDAAEAAGLRTEVMVTPSAARSYNVLLSEGRRVAAALIPV
ncbi:hypothetical protein DRW48_07530 [Paracoccus suum]|uniref:Mth938-like domain-containing protein n=1 Tax=Paracoccus suum TaxID=2259340 RepID=A0A344PJK5_9RHOB|nr:Mth938-like domain-containing protein [Paracoccus suum]AXC49560.1 hypothetical protein DRW48_07530 [Paracoccus suum]